MFINHVWDDGVSDSSDRGISCHSLVAHIKFGEVIRAWTPDPMLENYYPAILH